MPSTLAADQSRGRLAADPVVDFDAGPPRVSFEFFPPKTAEMEERLWAVVKRLEPLAPRFVSVTYGAGGSTRERTHATVRRIRRETALEPAAHLTCVGASREEIDTVARDYWEAGIRHIVALRGDPPGGIGDSGDGYAPHPRGYAYSADLGAGPRRRVDCRRAVPPAPHQRRARIPLLHAEPRRPDRRDLPPVGRARAQAGRGGGMMAHLLDYLVDRVLLCDGPIGTQVQGRTLHIEDDFHGHENCTDILCESRPDLVREIHLAYLHAGCDAVQTNSFGASPITL